MVMDSREEPGRRDGDGGGGDGHGATGLASVLRTWRDDILLGWEHLAREIPRATKRERPELADHAADLLDQLAAMSEQLARGEVPKLRRPIASQHAAHRIDEDFDLTSAVAEYTTLRQVILRTWVESGMPMPREEVLLLTSAIDRSVSTLVAEYMAAHDRTVVAIDRVSTDALASRSLDELLVRLAKCFRAIAPAIDRAIILLRDGDVLKVRAGHPRAVDAGVTMKIGEGFVGMIAAEQAPREAPGLYGAPLMVEGDVLGVAYIVSAMGHHFSSQTRRLFGAMVQRASIAVYLHLVHDRMRRDRAQLLEYERQFRTLADHIPQLAWMADPHGNAYWYNERWFEFTGTTPDEMAGDGWWSVHHPEHLPRVLESFRDAIATGSAWEEMFPIRGRDSRYRWFLSRAIPIRNAAGTIERWFGTNTDVTHQRFLDQATKILNESLDYRHTLQGLAHLTIPDFADWCVIDVLEHGVVHRVAIVHADPEKVALAEEYTRRFASHLRKGRSLERVIHDGETILIPDLTDEFLESRISDPEQLGMLRTLAPRSWIAAPLVSRGHSLGAISLFMSESGRQYRKADVALVEELGRRAGVAIENARLHKDAREAIRAREDMLAIVSHDLRNPLNTIDLGAALLARTTPDPGTRKQLHAIQRAAERMTQLINDLLDVSSINAGKLTMRMASEDAASLVAEVVDAHEELARERGIALVRDYVLDGVILRGDRNRLVQVLANLMGNALKFCRSGDTVTLRGAREDRALRIEVADTGPGIPADQLPHIFEPYWTTRRAHKEGTGLGLFISKAIVEAHGGTLSVASEHGHGATFKITLPTA